MAENKLLLFSGFANKYRTEDPAAPPTRANTIRRPGVAASNAEEGVGGVGLITRITF